MQVPEEVRRQSTAELWRRGSLRYKLHDTQKKLYDTLQGKRRFFLKCSRRLGKSYMLVCIAFETAIRVPGSRISYAAPSQKDATQIVGDLAAQILSDCPEDVFPSFHAVDKEYRFPNGSVVRFSGVNAEHHENLRGRAAHLFILDEVGQMDAFNYLLSSVVAPMVITTKGRILMASTPPRSPGHDMGKIAEQMEKKGELATFTLLDAPHIDDEEKFEALERAGEDPARIPDILAGKVLPLGTTALREYWCADVTDEDSAVIPEFTTAVAAEIVREQPRPDYTDRYVGMDPGMSDKTGILYAYWDFHAQKLIIEDESLLKKATTDTIGEEVASKELELWRGKKPLVRVSDIDPRLTADLIKNHGLTFTAANRQDALGAIDLVRTMVRRRELIIHPRCTSLIRQMKHATWNRKASDFERTQEDAHFDLLAALKYLCRVIIRNRNPFPSWYTNPGFGHTNGSSSKPKAKVFSSTPLGRRLAKKWG